MDVNNKVLCFEYTIMVGLQVGTREFIERDFDGVFDFLDLRRLLPLLGQVDVLELLSQHHSRSV